MYTVVFPTVKVEQTVMGACQPERYLVGDQTVFYAIQALADALQSAATVISGCKTPAGAPIGIGADVLPVPESQPFDGVALNLLNGLKGTVCTGNSLAAWKQFNIY